jgi:hypothetical protein
MPSNRKRTRREGKNNDWMIECHYFGVCRTKYAEKDRRKCLGLTVWDKQDPLSKWEDVEAELLPAWIASHPCSRPWSWWREAAPGPRRRTGGSGRRERNASLEFGVPSDAWFKDVIEGDGPRYESQTAYLLRLNLLAPAEKKWLADHPELLEPETIEYRLATGPEIYYAGYKGPGYYEDRTDI